MTYGSYGQFPIQFLIKIIEIWPMTAMGHFLYNSLSKSLIYDLWLPRAISFTLPYQNHWNVTCESYGPFQLQFLITIIEIWAMTTMGHFLYNSLSNSLKYDLRLLGAILFTVPYQNHWNMIYGCYGQFPLQFLIKVSETWLVTARGHFLDNSSSRPVKHDL